MSLGLAHTLSHASARGMQKWSFIRRFVSLEVTQAVKSSNAKPVFFLQAKV